MPSVCHVLTLLPIGFADSQSISSCFVSVSLRLNKTVHTTVISKACFCSAGD